MAVGDRVERSWIDRDHWGAVRHESDVIFDFSGLVQAASALAVSEI